jgi:hypothetical protein
MNLDKHQLNCLLLVPLLLNMTAATHKLKQTQSRCILSLGDSPAFEFYLPEFQNTCPFLLPAYTAYEDGTECSETSANKIQKLGNHPQERIQHSEHTKSLKSRNTISFFTVTPNLYSTVITICYSPYILPKSETA